MSGCSVPQRKRSLTREELQALLEADPDATLDQLKTVLRCGSETIARELARHGLKTRNWSERTHSLATRERISLFQVGRGQWQGSNNPNYGVHPRPWLRRKNPAMGERQRGENNPIHKVRYLYADPAYVERITSGIRAHVDAKKGRTYEEIYGEEKARQYKEKLRAASPARLAKFSRKVTEPERIVQAMLDEVSHTYLPQHPIGFYTVDFFVPSQFLVVQADGDYWHANPMFYTEDRLTPGQRKQRRLDHSCDAYMVNHGYRVVRLWEHDLHTRPEFCAGLLRKALNIR
jgi:very-short-patch-repair endonuclease